jgi:hypothetical protein
VSCPVGVVVELVVYVLDGHAGALECALEDGQLADITGQPRRRQGDHDVKLVSLRPVKQVE